MFVVKNDTIKELYPCIFYFTASWCGPCKKISPKFEELAENNKDIHFVKIDVDSNPKLAMMYNISSMPTFIFFKSAAEHSKLLGADSTKLENGVRNLKK